jgi:hypothetical protein
MMRPRITFRTEVTPAAFANRWQNLWLLFAVFLFQRTPLVSAETPPDVKLGPPTLLGITGLSVNGQVHSHGLPTTWYVEYGPTPSYGNQTVTRPIPPKLAAHYRESWDEGWNGWNSWCPRRLHFRKGGVKRGYISYEGSSKDDHNHDDGVGTVHLTPYMYPGSISLSDSAPSAYLAAGDPDFRDARVKLSVRGRNWQPNGTELIWWSQAQRNIEANPDDSTLSPHYRHANWSYTGRTLTDLLHSGRWETAEYQLLNDTNYWSYCGNNKGEKRYDAYWSIDETQRHLNLDLFHMVMFVDPQNRPTGAIDFDEFEVVYRNFSLVYPTNGGRLILSPQNSTDDPATLTDGWRHGEGKMWKSAANPAGAQEFVYEFARPVTIEKLQIHQHTEWPGKDVEVLVSNDGASWQPLISGEIPKTHPAGANYVFLLKKDLSANARLAKVRILSGYERQHWGLGEIELFGSGADYLPDDNWFHVNVDLLDLKPGETIHYRLVTTNSQGSTYGPNAQITLPTATKPRVITGMATRMKNGTAKVQGRLNPLGRKTQFYFEFGLTNDYGQKTSPSYGGLQITPRLGFATLTGLKPGAEYHYRLVAANEAGTSYGEDASFEAK